MGWFSKDKASEEQELSSDPTNPYCVEDEEGQWVTITHKKAEDSDENISSEENEDGSTDD